MSLLLQNGNRLRIQDGTSLNAQAVVSGPAINEDGSSVANFTIVAGSLTSSGGMIRPTSAATDSGGYHNTSMASANHYVEVVMVCGADVTDNYNTVIARWDGTDINAGGTAYFIVNDFGDGILRKVVAGTFTTIGTFAGAFPAGTHTVRLTCNGNQISASKNGVALGSSPYTDSSITTGTRVGLNLYSLTAATDVQIDSFVAYNL